MPPSELASELGKTGYLGRDDQAREHAFAAELAGQRAQADLAAKLAKDLTRIMGLFGADFGLFCAERPARPAQDCGSLNAFEE